MTHGVKKKKKKGQEEKKKVMFLSLFILFFHDGCRVFLLFFSSSPDPARLQRAPRWHPVGSTPGSPRAAPTSCPVAMPGHTDSPWGAAKEGKPNPMGTPTEPPGWVLGDEWGQRDGDTPLWVTALLGSLCRTQLQVEVYGCPHPQNYRGCFKAPCWDTPNAGCSWEGTSKTSQGCPKSRGGTKAH